MTEFCINIYRYFRNHRFVFWTILIAAFLFTGYFSSKIHLEEDINKLMPSTMNDDGTVKLAFANLKIKDKTFLLFESRNGNNTVESLSAVCDEFIDSLGSVPGVCDGESALIDNIFYQVPEEVFLDASDYFLEHYPAYIGDDIYAKLDTLMKPDNMRKQMLQNREDLLSEVGSVFPELIGTDPIGLRNVLAESYGLRKPEKQDTAGDGESPDSSAGDEDSSGSTGTAGKGGYTVMNNHFFVKDSTVCIAFITPKYSSSNTGQGGMLFETINEKIDEFSELYPDVRVCYHGTPASGYYNSTQIKADLLYTVGGALLLVVLFISLCFKSGNTLPFLLLPIVFGILCGLSSMYFINGSFSLLALGIGSVILGVALSYVLHVMTHSKYVNDMEEMLRHQVKPVCLGCITTIGSFIGLLFVENALLKDFGLFASFVIAGTVLFSLIFLPQLISMTENRRNEKAFALVDKITAYPFHRNKWIVGSIAVIVMVSISVFFSKGTRFDSNMHNLGYKANMTTYSEELLRAKTYTGEKQKNFASSGKTAEEALENFAILASKLDSLKAEGLVKDYMPVNRLFVPLKTQEERIRKWKEYWTEERIRNLRSTVNETAGYAGLRGEVFEPFFESLYKDFEADPLYEAGIVPDGAQSSLLEETYNGEYICYTTVRFSDDITEGKDSEYSRICDVISSEKPLVVLDTYYYTIDYLIQLNEDFNILQWVSMIFVFIVLLISFRFNIRNTMLGFFPILISWLVVLGFMIIFGKSFNLVNIIISTFIFGIGVDYSIFVMNGLVDGNNDNSLLGYHKGAIFFSAVTLIATVGSMLFAKHPAISSVGFSTLVGMLSAVILTWIMQPAIYELIIKRKR